MASLQEFPDWTLRFLARRGWHPIKSGTVVVAQKTLADQDERNTLLAALLDDRKQYQALTAKRNNDAETLIKALALTVLDGFNALRSQHGLAAISPAQFRTAIRDKIDEITT